MPTLQRTTLSEYETRIGVELTPRQLQQLLSVAPSINVAPSSHTEGTYDLTPGSSIGVVHLENLQVVVRAKVPIARIMFLISYAVTHGRWRDETATVAETDDLLEAVIPGFAFQLRKALARGVLQGYRSVEESSNTVRGRWRIGDQIRSRYGIAPPIEIEYDDFTEDIEANRLLRAAIHRLLQLRVRSDHARWGLRSLESTLSSVELVSYDPRRIPNVRYDRRSERYRPAVELARLILRSSSFDPTHGGVPASAFMIDMNRVFEDFIVLALGEAIDPSAGRLVQGGRMGGLRLDVERRISLLPDISLWRDGTCRFVGDVKYKRLRTSAYPNADLYQLLAYSVATNLPVGTLIYAAGEEDPTLHEVVHLGKRLETVAMRLDCSPQELLDQVKVLARRISDLPLAPAA